MALLSRRRLLGTTATGVGAALVAAIVGQQTTAAAQSTSDAGIEALLLNCIDYRLAGYATRYMEGRGLTKEYDQIVLAGAALAAVHPAVADWNQTFWDHVQVALDLHSIRRVIVMDHRDCGAFRVFLGPESIATPDSELQVHAVYLDTLRKQLNARYPQLGVELLLMDLDGSVLDLT